MKTIAVLLSVVAAAVALEPCVCTYEYSPVCGSDGITYGNLCGLKCKQRTDSALTLAYHGECKTVVEKRSEEPCNCTSEYSPVCGTDANTYNNLCMFVCARKNDPSLFLLYHGICKKGEKPVQMCTLEYFLICGSDGRTYTNRCEYEFNTRINKDLYIAKYGEEC
ncbi:PREDICTED: serine protease inhibitor dipetalogastin-like [Nicrophorus vespilloides]|uniref:Serine protease inhibitor dipetalogastin-like n=1 Tax=Nicrophorus vespilloides TaxID=110193 RepID=A0ABM1N705_NICVS|nr:PREDICTED: serine protease inhibitor dipetalogastin-like [Nicrophorus vespilloides]